MVKLLPELTTLFVFVDTPTDEKPPVLLFATGTEVEDPPKEKPLDAGVGAGAGVELVPVAAAGADEVPNEKPPVDGATVLFSLFDAGVVLPNENPPGAGAGAAGVGADEVPNEKPPVAGVVEAPVDGAGAGVDAPPNEKTITKSQ